MTQHNTETLAAQIPEELDDKRLDQVLARLFPDYSRSRLQHWIHQGLVSVDGQQVIVQVQPEIQDDWQAEDIPLQIVYEDKSLIVINKPAGLVVHPAVGNRSGTLLNALLHHAPELAQVPRAGIVHRLDKDTSGLLVIARNLKAQKSLVEQLLARCMG